MDKKDKYISYSDLSKLLARLKTFSTNNTTQKVSDLKTVLETLIETSDAELKTELEAEISAEATTRASADTALDTKIDESIATERTQTQTDVSNAKTALSNEITNKLVALLEDLSQRFVSKFVCGINSFSDLTSQDIRKKGQYYIANKDFKVNEDSTGGQTSFRQIHQGDRIVRLNDGETLTYDNFGTAWKVITQDTNGEYLTDKDVPIEVYNVAEEEDLPQYISELAEDTDPTSSALPHLDEEGTEELVNTYINNIPNNDIIINDDGSILTEQDLLDILAAN